MITKEIDLASAQPHGKVSVEFADGVLKTTALMSQNLRFEKNPDPIVHFVAFPERLRLPFRLDMTVRIDAPAFYVLLGRGHLSFSSGWDDNRKIDDFVDPDAKPRCFHNALPLNTFITISILCDYHFLQVAVDGEGRYFSRRERYMKSPALAEANREGFPLRLACTKRAELQIRSIAVTQVEDGDVLEPLPVETPPYSQRLEKTPKPDFADCISLLPADAHEQVLVTDAFLKGLKASKLKRKAEGNRLLSKITYASDAGYSYSLHVSGGVMRHTLWWYIMPTYQGERWRRKNDLTEATLQKLAEESPDFAGRMFSRLNECVGCCPGNCIGKTPYTFQGKKKLACHGRMEFKMVPGDFEDARKVIGAIEAILHQNSN